MQINIKLYGRLRQHLPDEQRGKTSLTVPEASTVNDVLVQLEIDDVVVIAINDEQAADYDTPLQAGDTVLLFEAAAGG